MSAHDLPRLSDHSSNLMARWFLPALILVFRLPRAIIASENDFYWVALDYFRLHDYIPIAHSPRASSRDVLMAGWARRPRAGLVSLHPGGVGAPPGTTRCPCRRPADRPGANAPRKARPDAGVKTPRWSAGRRACPQGTRRARRARSWLEAPCGAPPPQCVEGKRNSGVPGAAQIIRAMVHACGNAPVNPGNPPLAVPLDECQKFKANPLHRKEPLLNRGLEPESISGLFSKPQKHQLFRRSP